MQRKNTIIDGLKISYLQGDSFDVSKSVIIFLHGWGTSAKSFMPLFDIYHNYISLDFPGFGNSDKPKTIWDVDAYAYFVNQFLQKLKIEKFIFVAHSFGGRIVIRYNVIFNPKTVNVLLDSAGIKPKLKAKALYLFIAKLSKLFVNIPVLKVIHFKIRKAFYQQIGSEDYLNSGEMREIFKKVVDQDLTSDLSKIKNETILIWGENDQETPVKDALLMSKLIRRSKLYIIKNAGHFVYLDQTEEVNQIIKKFL